MTHVREGTNSIPLPNNGTINEQSPLPSGDRRKAEHQARVSSWISIEALSPQSYNKPVDLTGGDKRRLKTVSAQYLPWVHERGRQDKYQDFYQVVLGAVWVDAAVSELIRIHGEADEAGTDTDIGGSNSRAVLATILVDEAGRVGSQDSIKVSSFGWALAKVLNNQFDRLPAWPSVESQLAERLFQIVSSAPVLDWRHIEATHDWLVTELRLPAGFVEPPAYAVLTRTSRKAETPPDALLLNSFFIEDLDRVRSYLAGGGRARPLVQYLSGQPRETPIDLLHDNAGLADSVAPKQFPTTRWPAKGGFPLVLLQQGAVNLTRSQLAREGGLIGINGPPGTGKTTLLRDIIAAAVVDRASTLAAFTDPRDAFNASARHTFQSGGSVRIYELDQSVLGHEIVVTSSNNKAVENISHELPDINAIGRNLADMPIDYYKATSDALAYDGVQTWGLISTALGKAANRYAFSQTFWWDKHCGLQSFFKTLREGNTDDYRAEWAASVEAFEHLKREIEQDMADIEQHRGAIAAYSAAALEAAEYTDKVLALSGYLERIQDDLAASHIEVASCTTRHKDSMRALTDQRAAKPWFWHRWLRTPAHREWARTMAALDADASRAYEALLKQKQAVKNKETEQRKAQSDYVAANAHLTKVDSRLKTLKLKVAKARVVISGRVVDDVLINGARDTLHMTAPWVTDAVHRKREDLFFAALRIHKAFHCLCAREMHGNLCALMDIMTSGGRLQSPHARGLLRSLWSTLFLVVPVISTTCASFGRMFGNLGSEDLGWLLVDEAGQALPQAIAGALMRSQRAVIVGDPMQVAPISTLPERLAEELCSQNKVDHSQWAAPLASAQSLADRASRYQATFETNESRRSTGAPLLVHRRCEQPMFGISNEIAYANLMVYATGAADCADGGIGESCWFDVESNPPTKWSEAEGQHVCMLVDTLLANTADGDMPSIFIISPFRLVADEMRKMVQKQLRPALSQCSGLTPAQWGARNVGTIHTFQGREAQIVILLLGAPGPKYGGARMWATKAPNIVNVAVSRAQRRLYVVGDRRRWGKAGVAETMAARLPVATVSQPDPYAPAL